MSLCQFLTSADVGMTGMVLPQIGRYFAVDPAVSSWVVSANALATAGFLILGGRLTDVYGQRRCLMGCLVIYAGATVLSSLATSFGVLITGRTLQGLAAAVLGPASFSLITTYVPEGELRHKALGVFGIMQGVAMIVGLVLGGLIADLVSWRAVVAMTLPFSCLSLVLTRHVPCTRMPTGSLRNIGSPWSSILVTLAVGSFIYSLMVYGEGDWSSRLALGSLSLAVVCCLLFVYADRRSTQPLVPRVILQHRTFLIGCILSVTALVGFAPAYLLPNLYMQQLLKMSASAAGFGMLPLGVAGLISGNVAARLMQRFSLVRLQFAALTISGIGVLCLAILADSNDYVLAVALGTAIVGFGSNLTLMTVMGAATARVPVYLQGTGSGLLLVFLTLGYPIGDTLALAVYSARAPQGNPDAAAFRLPYLLMTAVMLVSVAIAMLELRSALVRNSVET